MPRENQDIRSFYYYLGTGKTRESCWFRPLEEEVSIPLVDWNDDNESVHDETEIESTDNMDVDESSKDNSEGENEQIQSLSIFKISIFNLVYKVEERFGSDVVNYENAIKAFTKQADKLSGDASIQKALHSFAKDVVGALKKGRRKNAGNIRVQNTVKSRRRIKKQGC